MTASTEGWDISIILPGDYDTVERHYGPDQEATKIAYVEAVRARFPNCMVVEKCL